MKERIWLITGAAGHLGSVIANFLAQNGERVRGLVLPNDKNVRFLNSAIEVVEGDVCAPRSLIPFFAHDPQTQEPVLIHAAGIVSISSKNNAMMYRVNVEGTRNIVHMCKQYHIPRLVYVSSVHAIPERKKGQIITESNTFDPDCVRGQYAKTKAMATKYVLEQANDQLSVSVVHPSGIIGPGDHSSAHLTQLVIDYLSGRLYACVKGGYDFVDVRDVAKGIISCVDHGKNGECYILSNRFYEISELLHTLQTVSQGKKIKTVLPMWIAKMTAPLSEWYYRRLKQPPLYTLYSLQTLESNGLFSHQKADTELSYTTRSLEQTLRDATVFLKENNRITQKAAVKHRRKKATASVR